MLQLLDSALKVAIFLRPTWVDNTHENPDNHDFYVYFDFSYGCKAKADCNGLHTNEYLSQWEERAGVGAFVGV